ncbi:hypothetical protein K438DRAFT_1757787 [Mycena galopus ATCC 62051]|nr:hypothetical protein K438DRAFT_1757787 [Mycena galopus ATCC 62051]
MWRRHPPALFCDHHIQPSTNHHIPSTNHHIPSTNCYATSATLMLPAIFGSGSDARGSSQTLLGVCAFRGFGSATKPTDRSETVTFVPDDTSGLEIVAAAGPSRIIPVYWRINSEEGVGDQIVQTKMKGIDIVLEPSPTREFRTASNLQRNLVEY